MPNTQQSLGDAIENMNATTELGGGTPRPMLVDMSRSQGGRPDARMHYARPESARVVSALAMVFGTPLSRMIANFFLGLNRAPVPMRLFGNRREAMEWLRSR
ncbi:MAG: STAS/SEC14 domain-containing protein [Archangiaceae bacterium]|nr:STAS/SEC14 domain-containing protein [Archangiaceae bacterium]